MRHVIWPIPWKEALSIKIPCSPAPMILKQLLIELYQRNPIKEPMKRQERDFSIARPFTICRRIQVHPFIYGIDRNWWKCPSLQTQFTGHVFYDTSDIRITNSEFGFYLGGEKKLSGSKFKLNGTVRVDKNSKFQCLGFTCIFCGIYPVRK